MRSKLLTPLGVHLPLVPALVVVLAGCSPSACSRFEPRELTPADSASRILAANTYVDTLQFVRTFGASDAGPLEYPRSIVPGPGSGFLVSDVQTGSVLRLDPNLDRLQLLASGIEYPYVAGMIGDTVVVYSAGEHSLHRLVRDEPAEVTRVRGPWPTRDVLSYAATVGARVVVKVLGEGFAGYLAVVGRDGSLSDRRTLYGPPWRHAGLLRSWGDSLLSLRGYRPLVDVLTPDGRLDSLALAGFDSPMLARSRLFSIGRLDRPPLLTSAAATCGDFLFVLNMRPGWIRIDVYDRSGHLTDALTQPDPGFDQSFFATDIAVRREGPASFILAVAVAQPEARIDLYRWSR